MYKVAARWSDGGRALGRRVASRVASRVGVGAAEAQAVLHRVQLGQPPALFARGDLALHPGLESAARAAAAVGLRERAPSPLPRHIKQAIKHIDISLLLADGRLAGGIGLTKRHISWYTFFDLELGY